MTVLSRTILLTNLIEIYMKKNYLSLGAILFGLAICLACNREDITRYYNLNDSEKVEDNTLSKKEVKLGYTLLWDGKTTTGWRSGRNGVETFPTKGWEIDNGILKVNKGKSGNNDRGGDIITVDKYENFILKVDFKITKGANSGIKYFINTDWQGGKGASIGCEYQLLDDENHPDAKLGVNGNRIMGSLYDLIPATDDVWKNFDMDSFHTAMIVVYGNHVEHWFDGIKVVEYERNTQEWNALVAYSKYKGWEGFGNFKTGHILLQDHGDEVWFKNIKIKIL
ncbi:MAG: DUF1080 domain-containing protein [Bacteroidales bacterium]|nr:DUF1080 domain-containing protein [Bacteroidales bacterium]